MSAPVPRIAPLGDAAVTVTLAETADERSRQLVLTLARDLGRHPIPGSIELVLATTTLTVHFDPDEVDYATVRTGLASRIPREPDSTGATAGRLIEIPVRYDGADLAATAAALGLTTDEVVRRHRGRDYEVWALGFVPGFAYLGPLDPALVLPRRSAPRPRVPRGAVAIAGHQTGVYPGDTPGGWHLLGTTRTVLFDPTREPPALLAVGDRVRFVPESP